MNSAVKLIRTDPTVSEDAELADVLEAYFQALEAGAAPSVEELLAQHPALADRLQRCLTSLQFVEGAASQMVLPAPLDNLAEADRRLGDYRLLREIGRGGMGIVYEAEQISLARRVALKVLPFASVLDSRQLQRFQNEALAAANLDHPNPSRRVFRPRTGALSQWSIGRRRFGAAQSDCDERGWRRNTH